MRAWVTLLVALAVLSPSSAGAVEIFINGVRANGLKGQTFEGCTVRFDEAGNLHITAKGYTIKQVEVKDQDPPPPTPSGRLFLVSTAVRPGHAQYAIELFVDGRLVRRVSSTEPQVVQDITSYLPRGRHRLRFRVTKDYGGRPRLSSSAADSLRVQVGEGKAAGGAVTVSRTLAGVSATADRTDSYTTEITISVP